LQGKRRNGFWKKKRCSFHFANDKLREANSELEQKLKVQSRVFEIEQETYRSLVENAEDIIFWIPQMAYSPKSTLRLQGF